MLRQGTRLSFSLLATALWWTALAQQTAQISGRVADPTGAVVPEARVSIVSNKTGVKYDATTDGLGLYLFPALQSGEYELSVNKDGFRPVKRTKIGLRVGDRIRLDIDLELGGQAQTVSVSAEIPLLRVDDAQSGLVIDNKRIQELPQYNRNPLAFALLTPNVNGTADQQGYSTDFRINGGRTAKAEYLIDGVAVTTGYRHEIPPSVPSMEAVAEFKVITNGISAEYGRLSGGAVTLVTRSGTNEFHGSAYEFFRNDKLNANDWNSNRFGRAKGVFHDNVFGGTFGGPVRIPKVYNGRDKTFFFINYEGTRRRTGSNAQLAGVPTELERNGDFTQTLIDNGRPAVIHDPLTARMSGARVLRDAFPGNRLPASRIDPLSKIYLGFYPLPNQAARPNSSHDQNFVGSASTPLDNNRWTGRLDQNWSAKHATHFTLTYFNDFSAAERWLSPLQPVSTNSNEAYTTSIDHTWTITPRTLLNLRGGLVRSVAYSGTEVASTVDASGWGMAPEVVNLVGGTKLRVPNLGTADTVNALGGGSINDWRDTSYSALATVTRMFGRHNLKFGYEHRRYYSNIIGGGTFSTSSIRSATSQYYDAPNNGSGSGFASWLLGVVAGGSGTQLAGPASLQPYHGLFIQDDIKLTRKLTINAGLRWDYEPPRTERYDRQTFWDRSYKWPWSPNAGWNWNRALTEAGGVQAAQPDWVNNGIYGRVALMGTKEYPMRTMQERQLDRLGPRIGAAYQLTPRTVMRASYGMIWMTLTGSFHMNGSPWNIGYGDAARLIQGGSPDGGLSFPLRFSNPMPGGAGYVRLTRDIDALNRSVMGNWFVSSATDISPGYEHVFQFGLQREVGSGPKSWVLEANYSGNLGRTLPYYLGTGEHILPNAYHKIGPLGNRLSASVTNPFVGQVPAFTGMGSNQLLFGRLFQRHPLWTEIWTLGEPLGTSNYHAGYVQAEHRFGSGFTLLANYTVSKLLNDVGSYDGGFGMPYPQAGLPVSNTYGIATSDISQKFLVNYSVDLPFGKGRAFAGDPQTLAAKFADHVIGGWTMAGTTTIRTGFPIAVRTPSNTVGGLGSQWYNIGHGRDSQPMFVTPRVNYDNNVSGHTSLEGAAGFQPFFNPASFRVVEGYEIGDAPSTMPNMRAPGFSQWDMSLLKTFRVHGEHKRLQLRFEAQNLFNKMNPGAPGNAILSRTFGVITGQSGTPRRVMVAAKFYF